MFAFAYDILLASVVTFFWTGFTSMQATFSLALSIVFTILVCTNTFMYYTLFTTGSKAQTNVKKVVPTVSFITNDVDKDRSR